MLGVGEGDPETGDGQYTVQGRSGYHGGILGHGTTHPLFVPVVV